MKNYIKLILLIIIAVLSMPIIECASTEKNDNANSEHSDELYTCGMHPNVVQKGPGTCPICGMYLTPLNSSTEENSDGSIKIDPVTIQNIGVRTETIERRDIIQHIRAFGKVEYDESQIGLVQTKFNGWVEKLYFNTTGQAVKKGDVLLEIYSPKLVTTQQEYLELLDKAEENEDDEDLKANLKAIQNRLRNFDISEDQIKMLEKERTVFRTIKVTSPFDGIIESKHVENGMEVKPNMKLYSISNLENIWIIVDIYESDAALIKPRLMVDIETEMLPGKTLQGEIDYIYPYLNEKTRAMQARIVIPNRDQMLKPGMFVNVYVHAEPVKNVVAIPTESVIFSGNRNLVFIDKGNGEYVPHDVTIGVESHDGYFEVKEELNAGEIVVTSAQFLMDSESRIQKNIAEMTSSSNTTDHSQHNH